MYISILYRIAIINDFRSTFACIDYKNFGATMTLGAWLHEPSVKHRQHPSDDIGIFLNYNQIKRTKNKAEAIKIINELLEDAPKEVIQQADYLFRAL